MLQCTTILSNYLSWSGGGGGIDLPQLPLLPPPSSLGGGGGAPFVLPDFSPCPQVSVVTRLHTITDTRELDIPIPIRLISRIYVTLEFITS